MTLLRCVGGPHDNQSVTVKDDEKFIKLSKITSPEFDVGFGPTLGGVYTETTYSVRHVTVADRRTEQEKREGFPRRPVFIIYLAPADWTDEQAIRHQFAKSR